MEFEYTKRYTVFDEPLNLTDLKTDNFYAINSIGIAGTSSNYELYVNGDVNITGILSATNVAIDNVTASTANLGIATIGTAKIGTAGITTISVGILTASSIGIGTTSPVTSFQVGSATTQSFFVTDLGSVGLGTSIPGEKLQVDGNIRVGISTTSNYIAFRGTSGDGVDDFGNSQPGYPYYTHTFIGERIYDNTGTEKSELFIFKGNDTGGGTIGPDRVRITAPEIRLDNLSLPLNGTFEEVGSSSYSTNAVIVTTTGNVGVGSEIPKTKLDVKGAIQITPGSSVTPTNIGDVVFEFTTNTSLTIKAKGTDGTIRSVILTLA